MALWRPVARPGLARGAAARPHRGASPPGAGAPGARRRRGRPPRGGMEGEEKGPAAARATCPRPAAKGPSEGWLGGVSKESEGNGGESFLFLGLKNGGNRVLFSNLAPGGAAVAPPPPAQAHPSPARRAGPRPPRAPPAPVGGFGTPFQSQKASLLRPPPQGPALGRADVNREARPGRSRPPPPPARARSPARGVWSPAWSVAGPAGASRAVPGPGPPSTRPRIPGEAANMAPSVTQPLAAGPPAHGVLSRRGPRRARQFKLGAPLTPVASPGPGGRQGPRAPKS